MFNVFPEILNFIDQSPFYYLELDSQLIHVKLVYFMYIVLSQLE